MGIEQLQLPNVTNFECYYEYKSFLDAVRSGQRFIVVDINEVTCDYAVDLTNTILYSQYGVKLTIGDLFLRVLAAI